MNKLIFATHNPHKAEEVSSILQGKFEIITLKDAGIHDPIPEPYNTLEENASQKSSTIYQRTNRDCFSEDTGLEVDALEGAPGVFSARYAGGEANAEKNIRKLLNEMSGKENRKARFRTVISLLLSGKEYLFEGVCNGYITEKPEGTSGFGYDPVFVPEGSTKTFAQMTTAEKNSFSHRKKAMDKLILFLQNL